MSSISEISPRIARLNDQVVGDVVLVVPRSLRIDLRQQVDLKHRGYGIKRRSQTSPTYSPRMSPGRNGSTAKTPNPWILGT